MCNLTFGFIYPEERSDEGSLRDPSLCSESLRTKPCTLPTLPTGRQAQAGNDYFIGYSAIRRCRE
jgi:hypothetical protein